ncbi:Uncharacterised protein [uncultured archaeon]|nr:Uncharacterised protein [uncultured archaeon]
MRGIYIGLGVVLILFIFYYFFSPPPQDDRVYPDDVVWFFNKIDSFNGKKLSSEQVATVRSTFTGSSVEIVVFDKEENRNRRKISFDNDTLIVTKESSAAAEIRLSDIAVHKLRPLIESSLADNAISAGEKAEIIAQVINLKAQGQILIEDPFLAKLIEDKTIDTLKSFLG